MIKLPLPDNIGKTIALEHEDGSKHYYTIVDEIARMKSDTANRALCFQRLQPSKGRLVQFRFCCYYADENEWVFAQDALYIPYSDLQPIIQEAIERGWIEIPGK